MGKRVEATLKDNKGFTKKIYLKDLIPTYRILVVKSMPLFVEPGIRVFESKTSVELVFDLDPQSMQDCANQTYIHAIYKERSNV